MPGHWIFLNSQQGTETTCMCSFAASTQSKKKLVQSGTAVCVSLRSAPCRSEHATVKMWIILSLSSAGPLHWLSMQNFVLLFSERWHLGFLQICNLQRSGSIFKIYLEAWCLPLTWDSYEDPEHFWPSKLVEYFIEREKLSLLFWGDSYPENCSMRTSNYVSAAPKTA